MNKSKISNIVLLILFALPIPLSIASWIGTIMSVAAIDMANWSNIGDWLQDVAALITMLLAGTYPISYAYSFKRRVHSRMWFYPISHIGLFIISMFLWNWLNDIFQW